MTYGGRRHGYEDVGPRVKQFGHFESADEEQVDPRILHEEARKAEAARKEHERRGPQSFATMRWSPEGGVQSAPFRARPHGPKQNDSEEDGVGFPAPPPSPYGPPQPPGEPGWGAVPMEPPRGERWPSAAASPWPNETVGHNPSPYGPPPIPPRSPYGPPPVPPSPYDRSQGGSPYGR